MKTARVRVGPSPRRSAAGLSDGTASTVGIRTVEPTYGQDSPGDHVVNLVQYS